MEEKEKRPLPGDPGYKGGTFFTRVKVNGVSKEVRTVKDAYGNVVYVSERDLLFGLF